MAKTIPVKVKEAYYVRVNYYNLAAETCNESRLQSNFKIKLPVIQFLGDRKLFFSTEPPLN